MPANKPPFDGEWVEFLDAFEEVSRRARKIKQKDYLPSGLYPIVDQGQSDVAGYANEQTGLYVDVPAIVFGDHTRCVKYMDVPFFIGADGVKILKPKLSDNVRYWWHALRTIPIEGLGYSRHYKLLKEACVRSYSLDMQISIRRKLDSVLLEIDRAKQCLVMLDTLVKSRFVEMFGDPAENTMSWDSASLTSLGSCKNGMNFKSKESGIELPCLGVGDFKDRTFINGVSEMGRVNLDTMPSEGYFLKDGDIVFVRSNGNKRLVGRCLAVFPNGEKAVYSGFCIRLRIESDRVRIPYLVWALRHPSMRQQMFGRGANVQNLNQKLMSNVEVPIPPLPEQDCFLDFVAEVDKSRFIVQQKIEKLQMLYDSLAQEYFG